MGEVFGGEEVYCEWATVGLIRPSLYEDLIQFNYQPCIVRVLTEHLGAGSIVC